jgi:hypothetical protein
MVTLVLTLLLSQAPAPAPEPHGWTPELSTLALLHQKGSLSDAEFESAVKDLRDSVGQKAVEGTTLVASKLALTVYGFVQANAIYDTTQGFTEQLGNGLVPRASTYAGAHDRFQLSARHSRFGFRLKAPELWGIRASAVFEMDFLGTQLPVGAGQPYFGTEANFIANPSFRARHLYLKVETPVVDVLAGQYWPVFGGQPSGNPNTVEIQGIAGQLYSRMPQVRVSKTLALGPATLDLIVAAVRSPQRDAGLPDAQAAVRFSLPGWQGWSTGGATNSGLNAASLTLSGDLRSVRLPEFSSTPVASHSALGGGVAADLYLPILRATKEHHEGALTFTGEFVLGRGTSDLYSGLNGGVTFPALPDGKTYAQDIDNGIAVYDALGTLHLIEWTTGLASLQYTLPALDGRLWLSAAYSRSVSPNTADWANGRSRASLDCVSGAVFADVLPWVRVGLEYQLMFDRFVDEVIARNHRANLGVWFLF